MMNKLQLIATEQKWRSYCGSFSIDHAPKLYCRLKFDLYFDNLRVSLIEQRHQLTKKIFLIISKAIH